MDRPFVEATGLDQNWGVFAPNPRRQGIELEARIVFADGTRAVWTHPKGDPVIHAYRTVRWRK